jgi:hypothetical protein
MQFRSKVVYALLVSLSLAIFAAISVSAAELEFENAEIDYGMTYTAASEFVCKNAEIGSITHTAASVCGCAICLGLHDVDRVYQVVNIVTVNGPWPTDIPPQPINNSGTTIVSCWASQSNFLVGWITEGFWTITYHWYSSPNQFLQIYTEIYTRRVIFVIRL